MLKQTILLYTKIRYKYLLYRLSKDSAVPAQFESNKANHIMHVETLSNMRIMMYKEILAQVFPCEFCKISKNTFSYRTPPVAASVFQDDADRQIQSPQSPSRYS